MKGGGLEGVSSATYLFWKVNLFENHLESFPDCENVFLLVWDWYYVYIVVEMALNMAK